MKCTIQIKESRLLSISTIVDYIPPSIVQGGDEVDDNSATLNLIIVQIMRIEKSKKGAKADNLPKSHDAAEF